MTPQTRFSLLTEMARGCLFRLRRPRAGLCAGIVSLLIWNLSALGQPALFSYDASGNLTNWTSRSLSPPSISSQPTTPLVQTNGYASFSVSVTNGGLVFFQWQFNGTNVAGATNDSLILTGVSSINLGNYAVVLSNSLGVVTSSVAGLQFDLDRDGLADAWEMNYFGSLTNQTGSQDFDADGVSNLDEFREGTNPTNRTSLFPRLTLRGIRGSASPSPNLSKYTLNQTVALMATPDPGLSFIGWFGSAAGTANPLNLTLDSSKSVTALFGLPLGQALDTNLNWTSGGDMGWFGQTNVTNDRIDAAQSGSIGPNEVSGMETSVVMTQPGTVSFWWKVDSEGGADFLRFFINGLEQSDKISGAGYWIRGTYSLPTGTNTLRWQYSKNDADRTFAVYFTDHAWVDQVVVTEYADPNLDSDSDGLPDLWEYRYWRELYFASGSSDNDSDGVSNRDEYLDGSDPTDAASVLPRLTIFSIGGTTIRSPDLPKYSYNQNVTVTATNPAPGFSFFGWAGDVLGTVNPSTLTLDRSKTVAAIFSLALPEAVDEPDFNWTVAGEVGWFGQTNVTHDGVDAAQSGPVNDNRYSTLATALNGPGTLTFWVRVTGYSQFLNFFINGAYQETLYGSANTTNWQQRTFYLGSGTNAFEWRHNKSYTGSISLTEASWIDQVSFAPGTVAPTLTIQPLDRTIGVGNNTTFTVAATGTPPLSYQWRFNGAPISGATNSSLALNTVAASQAGPYSAVVSNSGGSTPSRSAALTVVSTAPANDNFANRFELAGAAVSANGHNVLATKESGEPNHNAAAGGKSVWWTWTAPSNGAARVAVTSIDFGNRILLAAYAGNSVSALTNVGNGTGNTGTTNGTSVFSSEMTFEVRTGMAYRIAVDGASGASGAFALSLDLISAPPNDDFANRVALANSTYVATSGHNRWATKEGGEPNHANYTGGRSVWWSWTAPSGGLATLALSSTNFYNGILLGIYTGGSVSTLIPVASRFVGSVFTNGGYTYNGELTFNIAAGTTYQIAVDGYYGGSGNFDLSVQVTPPPGNDNFADRFVLGGATNVVAASNIGASKETGEPDHVGEPGGQSVWWTFTAPSNGISRITVPISDLPANVLLAVYTGTSISSLTLVTNSYGSYRFTNSTLIYTNRLVFLATAGTAYQIAVDALSGVSGHFTLATEFLPVPSNDSFGNRTVLSGATNSVRGYNIGATKEPGEPNHVFGTGGKSVWWTWTAPSTGSALIEVPWSDFESFVLLAVYRGTTVSNLISVASSLGSSTYANNLFVYTNRLIFNATAGTNYQIAIDGYNGASGEFPLSVAMATTPIITVQPQTQTVAAGTTVSLSVSAVGAVPLRYQWSFDGSSLAGATNSLLRLSNVTTNQSGDYTVVISNSYGSVGSQVATLAVFIPVPLAEALDLPGLIWTTGGSNNWVGQSFTTHDGIDAAQSEPITNGQHTWMETVVNGPGTLTFWWKVSSETGYDFLEFYVGGVQQSNRISGNVDWQQKSINLPSGSTTLRWRYVKDNLISSGQDRGWVDEVAFVGGRPNLGLPQLLANGQFQFTLSGEAGRTFDIEVSTNLIRWDWLNSLFNSSGTTAFTDTASTNFNGRFYRARLAP